MNTYKKPLNNIESLRNQIQQLQLDLTKQKQNIISKIYGNRSFETTPTMNQEEGQKSALFQNKISMRKDTQLHQDWNIYKSKQIERDKLQLQDQLHQLENEKKKKLDQLFQGIECRPITRVPTQEAVSQ
ncbi:unnamed protein product [Paramecium octaurelia]|uniref:Uncharacterized protein n=1 Tax=Paramecium octaurelia TaxID=43137 RepID=A0A8S1UZ30_PAROT|nr:unnamed protein product [Paramecium octaurelia]